MPSSDGQPARSADPSSVEWGYRPHLDGMRALAVFVVIAFHSGADRFSGGFIGVDVFFVLSGYLVTQVLLRDLRGDGSIGYRRFYARRFRRLLPAAAVVLVATAIVFPGIAAPAELADAEGAIRAAALYVSNWFFISQANDYFAGNVQASPVVHFWSLSVEEQFYLGWPLLLGGIYKVAQRARERAWMIVRIVVGGGLLLSLGRALMLADTDLNRAYFGTDTRVYQLFAGALLAMSPALIARLRDVRGLQPVLVLGSVVSTAGMLVLCTSFVDVDAIIRGVAATVATVVLIVCLEATAGGPVRFVLSLTPVVYLGRISYGIYLWHWIIILVTVQRFALNPIAVGAVAALLASGLAALSYQLLELPVRESPWLDRQRVAVVAGGLALSALVGLVVAPGLLDRDEPSGSGTVAGPAVAAGGTPIPEDLDWEAAFEDRGAFPNCIPQAMGKCRLAEGDGLHILVLGDSHARMYLPALRELAQGRSFSLSAAVAPGCPWQDGIVRDGEGPIGNEVQDLGPPCRAHHREWYDQVIPALDPDIIVVANQPWDDPYEPRPIADEDTGPVETGSEEFAEVVRTRTQAAIDRFRADGRTVVMIEPVPVASDGLDPLTCVSEATYLDECRFVTYTRPTPLEQIYRDIAAEAPEGAVSLDIDALLCPYLPICDPLVGGLIVRWDPAHLTETFARTLAEPLGTYLDDNVLVAP